MENDMETTLKKIASDLGELYRLRQLNELRAWQLEQDLAARKVYLTPVDGWPGKNAEQREIEAQRVFGQDGTCQQIGQAISDLREDAAEVTGHIEALEAERRAAEWAIRGRLADALAGRMNGRHGDAAESAFDDAADLVGLGVLDEQARKELEQAEYEHDNLAAHDEYRKDWTRIGPEDVHFMSAVDIADAALDRSDELPF